jgi:DNA modification methylase
MLLNKRIPIIQNIQVVKPNGRPITSQKTLQFSHYTIIWAVKQFGDYRFNDHWCRQASWRGDPYNAERGMMKPDVWQIPNSGHENKTGHPAQKSVALYRRMLTMCGKAGGTMLDLFGGTGTGAVAAMRWGMRSMSIERDAEYVGEIIQRVQTREGAT